MNGTYEIRCGCDLPSASLLGGLPRLRGASEAGVEVGALTLVGRGFLRGRPGLRGVGFISTEH